MTQHLYQGDARHLDMIDDGTIDLVVTSPPYLEQRAYGHDPDEIGRGRSLAEYVDDIVTVFDQLRRKMRPRTSSAWLNLGDKANGSGGAGGDWKRPGNGGRNKGGGPGRFQDLAYPEGTFLDVPGAVLRALLADRWRLRAYIVWDKGRCAPESVRHVGRPLVSHEPIFLLTPWPRPARPKFYPSQLAEAGSVWRFPPGGDGDPHLAPFPDELARRCILPCTLPGDTVLDPFAGSGTVPRVAEQLGRIGYGVDLYHGRPDMLTTAERPA